MGLLQDMKSEINKSGSNKSKVLFIKADTKKRIRFLCDFEKGISLMFHDSYSNGINAMCLEELGENCPLCDSEIEGMRDRKMYAWPVWDYDEKEVKIFLYAANNCSPVPALIGMYETYGTIMDRDYVISRSGKGTTTSYSVIPMDKAKFRNEKAKAPTENNMLKIIAKAFPTDVDVDDEDEDEDDSPKKSKGKKNSKSSKGNKKKQNKHDDDDDIDDDDDYEDEDEDEEDEKPKNKKASQKGGKSISKKNGKKKQEEEDDEDDDSDEEDDEDDELDYYEMSAKDLYALCKKRNIKAKQKKDEEYYIDLLEKDDKDEEDDDDEW